jgi:hypothetical protein
MVGQTGARQTGLDDIGFGVVIQQGQGAVAVTQGSVFEQSHLPQVTAVLVYLDLVEISLYDNTTAL